MEQEAFTPDYSLTPDECRNSLLNLMVDYLGIQWAKVHVMPHGGLKKIADARLPEVYARAQNEPRRVRGSSTVLLLFSAPVNSSLGRCSTRKPFPFIIAYRTGRSAGLSCTARSVDYPVRLLIQRHGDDRAFTAILPKLRCTCCGEAPRPVYLVAGLMRQSKKGGGGACWAVELVAPSAR